MDMDVFVGKGKTAEEAVDALKDKLWREVWKECVDVRCELRREGDMWIAEAKGLPGVDIEKLSDSERGAGGYGSTGN